MPLGSALVIARLMTAIQNMYADEGTGSQVVETTPSGGARIKRREPAPSAQPTRQAPREAEPAGPKPRSEMNKQERAEYNRLRREENRRKREAKHGRG